MFRGSGLQPGSRPPGVPGWGCMPTHVNGEAVPSLLHRSALLSSQAPTSRAPAPCLQPWLLLAVRGLSSRFACCPASPACLSVYFTSERGRARRLLSDCSNRHTGPTGAGGLAVVPGGSLLGSWLPGPWVLLVGAGSWPLGLGGLQQREQMACKIQVSVGQPPPRDPPPSQHAPWY